MKRHRLRLASGGFGLLALFALATGCGSHAETCKLSGKVLYNGKPLPGGFIMFRPGNPKLNTVTAEIDEQGNYEAVVPAGEVRVCVDNRELEARGARDVAGPTVPVSPDVIKKLGIAPPA